MAEQTTTVRYPSYIENAIKNVISETNKLYGAGAYPGYFPGDTVADFSPEQLQALEMLKGVATGPGLQQFTQQAMQANQSLMDPNMLWDLQSVPGYAAARQGIVDTTMGELRESAIPSVRQDAILQGNLGGSRASIGEALLGERAARALSGSLGNLDLNVFGNLLSAQQQALSRAPQIAQLQAYPGQLLSDVGEVKQRQNQAEIMGQKEKFDYERMAPWWLLDQLRTSAGMQAGSTTTQSTPGPGAGETIAGLLLAGMGTFGQGQGQGGYPGTPPYNPNAPAPGGPSNFTYFKSPWGD